jgi:DNA-binding NarL/FixJ family response regulator
MAISVATASPFSYLHEHPAARRRGPALAVVPTDDIDEELPAGLTPRDVEVLQLLAEGWTTAAIAHQLVYAESTIKKEVHLIVHRLGARNRTHAVALAIRGRVI